MKIEPFIPYPWDEIIRLEMEERDQLVSVTPVDDISVVLGRVTPSYPDVNMETCKQDNIPIYRRKGGGGCVLLFPGVIVVTAVYRKDKDLVNIEDFLNEMVRRIKDGIDSSQELTEELGIKGMGDLCLGNKKILGSSVYSTRDFIGYYGSLIVKGDVSLISRYLGPPSKEPSYRQGRDHANFVTSIEACCDKIKDKELFLEIENRLRLFSLDLMKN